MGIQSCKKYMYFHPVLVITRTSLFVRWMPAVFDRNRSLLYRFLDPEDVNWKSYHEGAQFLHVRCGEYYNNLTRPPRQNNNRLLTGRGSAPNTEPTYPFWRRENALGVREIEALRRKSELELFDLSSVFCPWHDFEPSESPWTPCNSYNEVFPAAKYAEQVPSSIWPPSGGWFPVRDVRFSTLCAVSGSCWRYWPPRRLRVVPRFSPSAMRSIHAGVFGPWKSWVLRHISSGRATRGPPVAIRTYTPWETQTSTAGKIRR